MTLLGFQTSISHSKLLGSSDPFPLNELALVLPRLQYKVIPSFALGDEAIHGPWPEWPSFARQRPSPFFLEPKVAQDSSKVLRRKRNNSNHDAGPSGVSPAPASYRWWSLSMASTVGCDEEAGGLDCFYQICSRVFLANVLSLSTIPLTCRGFVVKYTHL
jgi:hypothetical protein